MRVALLCPYSLSRPGGVQGQVARLGRRAGRCRARRRGARPRRRRRRRAPASSPGALVRLGRSVALPRQRVGGPGGARPGRRGAGRAGRARGRVRRPAPARAVGARARLRLSGGVRAAQGRDVPPRRARASPTGCSVPWRAPWRGAWRRAARCRPRRAATAQRRAGRDLRDHRQRHRPRALRHRRRLCDVGAHGVVRGPPRRAQGSRGPARGGGAARPGRRPDRVGGGRGPRHRVAAPPASVRATGSCGWVGSTTTSLRRASPGPTRCARRRSRGESFGVVLLEAMAARTAVVASDIPGYEAVVGGHGLLVPPGDVAALASGPARPWPPMPPPARACVPPPPSTPPSRHASQWSMPEVAERYVAVYERVVAQRRAVTLSPGLRGVGRRPYTSGPWPTPLPRRAPRRARTPVPAASAVPGRPRERAGERVGAAVRGEPAGPERPGAGAVGAGAGRSTGGGRGGLGVQVRRRSAGVGERWLGRRRAQAWRFGPGPGRRRGPTGPQRRWRGSQAGRGAHRPRREPVGNRTVRQSARLGTGTARRRVAAVGNPRPSSVPVTAGHQRRQRRVPSQPSSCPGSSRPRPGSWCSSSSRRCVSPSGLDIVGLVAGVVAGLVVWLTLWRGATRFVLRALGARPGTGGGAGAGREPRRRVVRHHGGRTARHPRHRRVGPPGVGARVARAGRR